MGTLRFATMTPSEVLQARMQGVRKARPLWTAEEARAYSLAIDPPLARAYAEHPHSIEPQDPSMEAEAYARRADAGREVVRRARALVAQAAPGALTIEQAIHTALHADAELTRTYAGLV